MEKGKGGTGSAYACWAVVGTPIEKAQRTGDTPTLVCCWKLKSLSIDLLDYDGSTTNYNDGRIES